MTRQYFIKTLHCVLCCSWHLPLVFINSNYFYTPGVRHNFPVTVPLFSLHFQGFIVQMVNSVYLEAGVCLVRPSNVFHTSSLVFFIFISYLQLEAYVCVLCSVCLCTAFRIPEELIYTSACGYLGFYWAPIVQPYCNSCTFLFWCLLVFYVQSPVYYSTNNAKLVNFTFRIPVILVRDFAPQITEIRYLFNDLSNLWASPSSIISSFSYYISFIHFAII